MVGDLVHGYKSCLLVTLLLCVALLYLAQSRILQPPAATITSRRRLGLRGHFNRSLATMEAACGEPALRGLEVNTVPDSRFSFDPVTKMLMCKTAKHGSTTWSKYFVTIYKNGYISEYLEM